MIHTHRQLLSEQSPDRQSRQSLADLLKDEGITKLMATPVYQENQSVMTKETILAQTREWQYTLKQQAFPVEIIPAQYVVVTSQLLDDIKTDRILFINQTSGYLYVILPDDQLPLYLDHFIYELQREQITPVIVHPEQSSFFYQYPERLYDLVRHGVMVDLSVWSLLGEHGKKVKRFSEQLLEANLVQLLSLNVEPLAMKRLTFKRINKLLSKALSSVELNYFETNSEALISGDRLRLLEPMRVVRKGRRLVYEGKF